MDKAAIKQKVCEAIAAHRADIEAISEAILAEPELGFKEVKTSRKVQEALERLGIEFTAGHGITGVKARMKGRNSKRTVAMLAELDAIVCRNHRNANPVTGAAHCCGHNIQIANMIAVACGLRDVMSELDGDVVLFAVPAEEYVEIDWRNAQRDEGRLKYLGGKQQLIAEGAFEDIDMAVRTIRKDTPSDEEMRHAGKVMTELDGTELFSRITESLTDEAMSGRLAKAMAVFVDTVNMTVTRQKDKVFVIPDKIEEFDIRDYV